MQKRILTVLLAGTLLLGGCLPESLTNRFKKQDTSLTAEETDVPTADTATEDTAYLNIECYQPKYFSNRYVSSEKSRLVLKLSLPDEWLITKAKDGRFSLHRNGAEIGFMVVGEATDLSQWTVLKQESNKYNGINVTMDLEKTGTEDSLAFRYRYVYRYSDGKKDQTVTLAVAYAEASEFTSRKLLIAASTAQTETDPAYGILSHCKDGPILILGNSFIGSSNIGAILDEMMVRNSGNTVTRAISRGYATVNTYVSDSSIMEQILGGAYSAVFICGFYSAGELTHLKTLKSACQKSDTELVIFPAHNENASVISSACSANPDLICLNWKAEIDALIQTGIDKWDFCVDDTHKHSKPLAGYVGAHMIFRALYGSSPLGLMQNSIDQQSVEDLLGSYVETGCVKQTDTSQILYFY